jgi:hypothetical protein
MIANHPEKTVNPSGLRMEGVKMVLRAQASIFGWMIEELQVGRRPHRQTKRQKENGQHDVVVDTSDRT